MSAERIMKLFGGYTQAYGSFVIKNKNHSKNKLEGTAKIVQDAVTVERWQLHLDGKQSIGIIPIDENNKVSWGCLDIDKYDDFDVVALAVRLDQLKLPLVTVRSKSGGAHVFAFTKTKIAAYKMQYKLQDIAASLGFGGCEVFPKQTEVLYDQEDFGSWLNMPYFNVEETLRYGVHPNGSHLTLDEFLTVAESAQLSEKDFDRIGVPETRETGDLAGAPPCLQIMAERGIPEGGRDNAMLSFGVFCRKKWPDSDVWKDKMEDFNLSVMDPPLKSQDMQRLVKQTGNKDYGYKCSDAPIKDFCNKGKCRTCKFGVGSRESSRTYSGLSKLDTEDPIWYLTVDGHRVALNTEELQAQTKFQAACMRSLNFMPPIMKSTDWRDTVQSLLDDVTIIEPAAEVTRVGEFHDHVKMFCTRRGHSANLEDVFRDKAVLHEGFHIFKLSALEEYLKSKKFTGYTKRGELSEALKAMGSDHQTQFRYKNDRTSVWKVPQFDMQDEDFDLPNMGEDELDI